MTGETTTTPMETTDHGAKAILPWQQPLLDRLTQLYHQGQLAHALLLTAVAGNGQDAFALALSRRLLCLRASACVSDETPCHSCQLLQAGTHPDYHPLGLSDASASIKVDAVRSLTNSVYQTSSISSCRVILIAPASKLNIAASNALLKMLEEPPAQTFFILLAAQSSHVLPTIASRCQHDTLPEPDVNALLAWLDVAQSDLSSIVGAKYMGPETLAALVAEARQAEGSEPNVATVLTRDLAQLQQNPSTLTQIAKSWLVYPLEEMVEQWIYLVAAKITQQQRQLVEKNQSSALFGFLNTLYTIQQGLLAQQHLNVQLVYESLLIDWQDV